MEPKSGDVWAIKWGLFEIDEFEVLQVTPEAVKLKEFPLCEWMTRHLFNARCVSRVGRYQRRNGWRRLFGKRELIRD